MTLALAGLAALQRFDGALERHDFAGQQILAHEVLVRLAAGGLIQIDDGHRNFGPAQAAGKLQAAAARQSDGPSGVTTTGWSRPTSAMLSARARRSPKSLR